MNKKNAKEKISKLRKVLEDKSKSFAVAGLLVAGIPAGAPTGTTAENSDDQNDSQSTIELSVNDVKKVLEENNDIFQDAVMKMKQEGRFFVNAADLTDVIYLPNDSVQEYQIPYESKIFSVSLARENNITNTSSREDYVASYTNTKGLYYSAYQYSGNEMKNMTLWTLGQKDESCQEFARRCIASAMHLSDNDAQSLVQAYIDAHEKVVSGETSIAQTLTVNGKPLLKDNSAVETFINELDAAKENISNGKDSKYELSKVFYYKGDTRNNALKAIGLDKFTDDQLLYVQKTMDFPKIEYVFDRDAGERYFLMKFDQNELKNVPMMSMPVLFAAGIHGNQKNAEELNSELKLAQKNQYSTLITKHSKHKDPAATKRAKNAMNSAQRDLKKEINGKTYYDLALVQQYQQISNQPSTTTEKVSALAAEYIVESPKNSLLYTAVLSNTSREGEHEISAPKLYVEPDLNKMPKQIHATSSTSSKSFAYNNVVNKER